MTATIAPPQCAPCLYALYEQHRDACLACTAALHADVMCFEGLILLDAALGDAGLEVDPDLRWRRETGRDARGWSFDERRRFAIWRSLAPHPERRDAVIDLSLDLAVVDGDVWPTAIVARRIIASRLLFVRWRLGISDWPVAS